MGIGLGLGLGLGLGIGIGIGTGFVRMAETSRQRMAEVCLKTVTGKGLSMKMRHAWPSASPTTSPSRPAGPPVTWFGVGVDRGVRVRG